MYLVDDEFVELADSMARICSQASDLLLNGEGLGVGAVFMALVLQELSDDYYRARRVISDA